MDLVREQTFGQPHNGFVRQYIHDLIKKKKKQCHWNKLSRSDTRQSQFQSASPIKALTPPGNEKFFEFFDLLSPSHRRSSPVIMSDYFSEDKIEKVMSGTLRLQTEFEYSHLFPSKMGAGVLYNKEGHILTNAHVVSDSFEVLSGSTMVKHWVVGKVVANFNGGEQCDAEVLSVDVGKDVALLKIPESVIKPSNIPCVFSKDVPGRGDKVFVVGHPHGVPFNVKYGHVSNPSRPLSDIRAFVQNCFPHSFEYMDPDMTFLEIDVTAAKGSSGGPISAAEGSVFGVLHSGIQGITYGIPFAIIESAVGRMVQRSSRGDNVFCHLN